MTNVKQHEAPGRPGTRYESSIVVVEDELDDFDLLERAFRQAGLGETLVRVADGDEAVRLLSTGVTSDGAAVAMPRLLLLDLKLPRRNGLQVLEWVRTQPGLRRIPVVVLTSSREPKDLARAYDLGANSYLVKPVGMDTLVNLVQAMHYYWLALNERPDARFREGGGEQGPQ